MAASCSLKRGTPQYARFMSALRARNIKLPPSLHNHLILVDEFFMNRNVKLLDVSKTAKTMHNLTMKMTLTFLYFDEVLTPWSEYNNWFYSQMKNRYSPLLTEYVARSRNLPPGSVSITAGPSIKRS